MKELNMTEANNVSGGDFGFTVTLFVPSSIGGQFAGYFQQLIVGYLYDTENLVNDINNAITGGMDIDSIRIESIEYSSLN
ncbi:MAG: hypothetical protein JSS07_00100 [Proteobacteria bacterium]|nr:hypothetical protein [Pseudomonadota bacterium]